MQWSPPAHAIGVEVVDVGDEQDTLRDRRPAHTLTVCEVPLRDARAVLVATGLVTLRINSPA